MSKISFITPTQGNVKALKSTIESFKHVVDEFIIGDLCLFDDDVKAIEGYMSEYNLKIVRLPFNSIFINGFSNTLNLLASYASNDLVLYMNVSEVMEEQVDFLDKITDEYNSYVFNHLTDPHRWVRLYNKKELQWSGLIHESVIGEHRTLETPIFTMKDLEKDSDSEFKSKVYNDLKELCYFNQYIKIIDQPHLLGATNPGWINFAQDGYHSFIERLHKKGNRYEAMITGDLKMYLKDIFTSKEFEDERFNSSLAIEFQGSPMFLGKK